MHTVSPTFLCIHVKLFLWFRGLILYSSKLLRGKIFPLVKVLSVQRGTETSSIHAMCMPLINLEEFHESFLLFPTFFCLLSSKYICVSHYVAGLDNVYIYIHESQEQNYSLSYQCMYILCWQFLSGTVSQANNNISSLYAQLVNSHLSLWQQVGGQWLFAHLEVSPNVTE